MNFSQLKKLFKYANQNAVEISQMPEVNLSRSSLFFDILRCYNKYHIYAIQYKKEKFWQLSPEQRNEVAKKYREKNVKNEAWAKDYYENFRFLIKWTAYKYEATAKQQKRRLDAYRRRYDIGVNCFIGHDVLIERHHHLWGTIKIGNNCLLAKHVYIDYSGDVIIENGVKLAQGVVIESHHRDIDAYIQGKDVNIPTQLRICENTYIGTNAIILDSCNYIGRNVRIGAGAVVTKDIPDNTIVGGVPAKVIRMVGKAFDSST